MIIVLEPCRRELQRFPASVRADLADALARLDEGHTLSMPLSRPMPSIGSGVHELRLRDRSGAYRTIYAVVRGGTVYVVHAFKKTTRATAKRNIELACRRLKELNR